MTELTRDDLRAAVTAGVISEGQAASLVTLSDQRRGVREHLSGLDEPFELFKGFNEIFIVVGLVILFGGYAGLTGLSSLGSSTGYLLGMIYPAVAMVGIVFLARYFTLTRRMVAPSIALAIMFGISAFQFGYSLSAAFNLSTQAIFTTSAVVAGVVLSGYYLLFRVPFTVALIALCVFGAVFGVALMGGSIPESPLDIFLLSADGPFAVATIVLGLIGLSVAMLFDMSDPHRVTRRAQSAFWLHVIAAPAIVNTVALTLFEIETMGAYLGIVGFVTAMALLAVIIDRRSFLVSGVGYIVALSITVIEGNAFIVILILGAGLVLLGAKWEAMRRALMRVLPGFPGKTRLPPYEILIPEAKAP